MKPSESTKGNSQTTRSSDKSSDQPRERPADAKNGALITKPRPTTMMNAFSLSVKRIPLNQELKLSLLIPLKTEFLSPPILSPKTIKFRSNSWKSTPSPSDDLF
jgi:hypothetical protein